MRLTALKPVPRTYLWQDAAAALRQAMVTGDLKPGDRVSEARIARQLGVSRAPVRDAIQVLVKEGLLAQRNGATEVVGCSDQDGPYPRGGGGAIRPHLGPPRGGRRPPRGVTRAGASRPSGGGPSDAAQADAGQRTRPDQAAPAAAGTCQRELTRILDEDSLGSTLLGVEPDPRPSACDHGVVVDGGYLTLR